MAEANVVGGIVQPNVDIVGGMKSWADLQMAQSHADLFAAQARQANMKQNALARAAELRARGDEEGALNAIASVDPATAETMRKFGQDVKSDKAKDARGKALLAENPDMKASDKAIVGQPDIQATVATTEQTKANTHKTELENWQTKAKIGVNQAAELFKQKEEGTIDQPTFVSRWNTIIAKAHKDGIMSDMEFNSLYDRPDKQYIEATQKALISTQEYLENSGVPTGNKEWAKVAPNTQEAYNKAKIEAAKTQASVTNSAPNSEVMVPNASALDNLNLGYGPAGKPPTAAAAIQPGAVVPASQAAQPPAEGAPATVPTKWGDVPVVGNLAGPPRPGVIKQAIPEGTNEAIKETNKNVGELVKQGDSAQVNIEKTTRIIDALESGKVKTSAVAPYQRRVAAWVYGISGGDLDAVKNIMGKDYSLPAAESLEKEFTQMGLKFARDTEGAREAVAAIKIALGGQPQMTNTVEGNLKIAKVLRAVAQWEADRASAAKQYGMAQATKGQNGYHYMGFQDWWNSNHPAVEYTTKATPLDAAAANGNYTPKAYYEGTRDGKKTVGQFIGYAEDGTPQFKAGK